MNETLQIAGFAALWASVLRHLINPGEALSWYGRWLFRMQERREWLAKPLGLCAACHAGQVALFGYPLLAMWHAQPYGAACHLVAVLLAIFTGKKMNEWLND
jgi:hypothetical protein